MHRIISTSKHLMSFKYNVCCYCSFFFTSIFWLGSPVFFFYSVDACNSRFWRIISYSLESKRFQLGIFFFLLFFFISVLIISINRPIFFRLGWFVRIWLTLMSIKYFWCTLSTLPFIKVHKLLFCLLKGILIMVSNKVFNGIY